MHNPQIVQLQCTATTGELKKMETEKWARCEIAVDWWQLRSSKAN